MTAPTTTPPALTPEALRAVRRTLGLTQAELAELVGLHPNTVACMERGDKPISRRTAVTVVLLASR